MMLELACGIAPEPTTSWEEMRLRDALTAECLPELWRRAVNGTSLFISSSPAARTSVQRQLGFDVVLEAADLRRKCAERSFAHRCGRLHVRLSQRCVLRLRKRKGRSMRDRLLSYLISPSASPNSSETACGRFDAGPAMHPSDLRQCLDDPCLDELHGGAAPTGWHHATNATGDMQMLEPTLDFAAAAAVERRPFFTFLLTTATHYPYHPSILERPVGDNGTRLRGRGFAGRSYAGLRHEYLDRVRESDELARRLFFGLRERGLEQTLFIVLGDHGEDFNDDGTSRQHGSCVSVECVRVPFVMHDPSQVSSSSPGVALASRLSWPPTSGKESQPRWLLGLSRHADILPTVLRWVGFSLSSSTATGILRPGKRIVATNSRQYHTQPPARCIPIFAFFDQRRRAVACSTSMWIQALTSTGGNSTMRQATNLMGYSMYDRRHASSSHLVLPLIEWQYIDGRRLRASSARTQRKFAALGRVLSKTRQLYARWRELGVPDSVAISAAQDLQQTYRSLLKTQLTGLVHAARSRRKPPGRQSSELEERSRSSARGAQ